MMIRNDLLVNPDKFLFFELIGNDPFGNDTLKIIVKVKEITAIRECEDKTSVFIYTGDNVFHIIGTFEELTKVILELQ
jgi:hypothetical protein